MSSSEVLSAADSVVEISRLAAACADAFVRLAGAAGDTQRPPSVRVALSAASRVLGEHAQALTALIPESVLLESARAEGSISPSPLADDPVVALSELVTRVEVLASQAGGVADGALVRRLAYMRLDLAASTSAVTAAAS